nr:hypothetical protein GCM10020063_055720 [Dactylosporangium thailandense]
MTAPRIVLQEAGEWLGAALAAEGFAWRPRQKALQRERDGLIQEIAFSPSSCNRTGQSVSAVAYLAARDPALRAWRGGGDDRYCAIAMGYASGRANGYIYGSFHDGVFEWLDPAARADCLMKIREGVLPWFAEASDPETIAGSFAGDSTVNPDGVVEWLASRGRPDLVAAYGERQRARYPGGDERWAAGVAAARAGRPRPGAPDHDRWLDLAWMVTRYGPAQPPS